MSFYLMLQPPVGGPQLEPDDADRVLRAIPNITHRVQRDGTEYLYQNAQTGVHFTFDLATGNTDQHPASDGSSFSNNGTSVGSNGVSLSFDINLARPSFFALEAMPIVAAVADTLQLMIVDPQNNGVNPWAPLHTMAAALVRSWEQSNRWAISVLRTRQGADLTYYPRSKATYHWAWTYFRSEIEEKHAERSVHIPQTFILRRPGRQRLFTAIAWPKRTNSLLIPAVDVVILTRESGDRRGRGGEVWEGVVTRRTLVRALKFGMQRVAEPVPHWHYTDQGASRAHRLAAIGQLRLSSAEGLQAASVDGFVDVPCSVSPARQDQLISLISMN